MKIDLFHAGGQTAFESEDVLSYGSLDALIAGDMLAGIPDRERSLASLWRAAQLPEPKTMTPEEIKAMMADLEDEAATDTAPVEGKSATE